MGADLVRKPQHLVRHLERIEMQQCDRHQLDRLNSGGVVLERLVQNRDSGLRVTVVEGDVSPEHSHRHVVVELAL